MKKLIGSILLVGALAGGLQAQSDLESRPPKNSMHKNKSPEEKVKSEVEQAQKTLGLSADQKTKWEAAAMERVTANTVIRKKLEGSTTPEERMQLRKELKNNHSKFDETANSFLTAEQKAKREEMKKQRQDKHHKRHGHQPSTK